MSASLIDGTDEEANAEGTLRWVAGLGLCLLANDGDEALTGVL